MKIRLATSVAATLLLALTACGGGDDAQTKKDVAKALMGSADTTLPLKQKDADCIAAGWVDKLGADKAVKYGLTKKSALGSVKMSSKDADSAAGVMVKCVDLGQMVKDQMGSVADGQVGECLDKAFSDEVMTRIMSKALQGENVQSVTAAELQAPMTACMTG